MAIRRPYLIASLAVHAGLLLAFFYAGPYRIRSAALERNVRHAQDSDIKRRVQELEKIKSLLEQGERGPGAASSKTDPAATPLEQARQLSEAIAQIERRSKTRELARLLGISEEEARRKLPAPAKPAPAKAPLAELQQYQQQARAALLQREAQMERERSGTPLQSSGGNAVASHLAGLGDGGSGKAGKGGAGEHGVPGADIPNASKIAITSYIDQTGLALGKEPRGGSWDLTVPRHKVARGYGAYIPAPAIDMAAPRKLTAHAIGNGAPYADRVYLNRWHVIGPFAGHGQESIDVVYPPEMTVDLDAAYPGNGGRTLTWEYLTNPDYPTVPPLRAEDAVYYAYTEVVMAEEGDLVLAIGSDDDSKLWLNERLAWVSGDGNKAWYSSPGYVGMARDIAQWNLSEGTRKLHFRKGRNSLLLKLYNGASLAFFSVVIVADNQAR